MKGLKSKGAKLPKSPSTAMGEVAKAPSTKKKAMPTANAPAGVASGDGDGAVIAVTSDMAKMAPSTKGSKKEQGASVSLPSSNGLGDTEV